MTKGKKGLSEIVFILDESGSMHSTTKDTIGGFNQFIQTQREMPGEAKFTLVKFNSSWSGVDKGYEIVHSGVDLADVEDLNEKTYSPGGATALLDAVGSAIADVKKRHGKKKAVRPEKVIFAILTDGEENSSTEYDAKTIRKLVKAQEKKKWNFLFLGADIDAWDEGSKYGFGKMSASVDKHKMGSTFAKMSYFTGTTRDGTGSGIGGAATMDTFEMSDEAVEQGLKDLKNKKDDD